MPKSEKACEVVEFLNIIETNVSINAEGNFFFKPEKSITSKSIFSLHIFIVLLVHRGYTNSTVNTDLKSLFI
jgi:hypothetical protein